MVNTNYIPCDEIIFLYGETSTCPETERLAYEWDMTHDKNMVKEEELLKL